MKTKSGEEYLSSKNACAVSSYSDKELRSLCLEGKLKSHWLHGGYFVEKNSLMDHLKRGTSQAYTDVDIEQSFDVWHSRVFRKFGMIAGVIGLFSIVLILPFFFARGTGLSGYDLTQAPSPYNSTLRMAGGAGNSGSLASTGQVSKAVEGVVEKGAVSLYDKISSFFK